MNCRSSAPPNSVIAWPGIEEEGDLQARELRRMRDHAVAPVGRADADA